MQNIKFTGYSLLFTALFIESVFLFLLAPRYYQYEFNLFCMFQYLVSSFLFLRAKKKQNYFDFDMIFMFTFFFVMFFYPVFMFESDPTKYFAFKYEFNENVISRATALSLLGMQAYFLGSLTYMQKDRENKKVVSQKQDGITSLSIISLGTFVLFIFFGGYAKLAGEYSGQEVEASGVAAYLYVFFPVFLLCAIAFQFNKFFSFDKEKLQFKKINKMLLLCFLLILGMLIIAGSRTIPLQLVLVCGGLFTMFYKQISFIKFLPLVIIGVLLMFAVNVMRGGGTGGVSELADVVMDLIICNRNTYMAVDYVDVNGITYGKSMLSPVLSSIPFLQNIVFTLFSINPSDAGSAVFFTKLTLGEGSSLGLGTNIIADLYLSFGMFGVMFCMFLLGRYISKFIFLAKKNIYALVFYSVMMSYSVFIVRAEFFYFIRYLVWCLFTVFLMKLLQNSTKYLDKY